MIIISIAAVCVAGLLGWWIARLQSKSIIQTEKALSQQEYVRLEKEYIEYKATVSAELLSTKSNLDSKNSELLSLHEKMTATDVELSRITSEQNITNANFQAIEKALTEKNVELQNLKEELTKVKTQSSIISQDLATAKATGQALSEKSETQKTELRNIKEELQQVKTEFSQTTQELATAKANNHALTEKLETQKNEIEELGKRFNTEFELIANKILDTKTEKFTQLNKDNLKAILEPLGKNIGEFKTKVEEVYDKESKERFSLGERVKELTILNQVISDEARNLTKALKGESKTQGRWGEMILESILEKSGLVKDRNYFLEKELLSPKGEALKSDSEGKKMRPDVIINYPDHRSVIIDSKVSLNAFTRFMAASDVEEQKKELAGHVDAIKNHIIALSAKGYDDYDKTLDFVMMFIPSEPAYSTALQADPDLWNFAYDKRILLISPTNLITCLKLIVDLWKREYQNQNALEIADRGAKLYDKFVGFVTNLEDVGDYITKAQGKYDEAYKQLKTGNDNLVLQATKLKNLGLKTKKELPQGMVDELGSKDLSEPEKE